MGKPFFYKIIAAELMAEVLQIPDGKHKEWLTQFVLDLVSAKGNTPYAEKLIGEVQEFREKQAISGAAGGKKSRRKKVSDPQAGLKRPLSDPQAGLPQALGRSSSSNSTNYPLPRGEMLLLEEGLLAERFVFNGAKTIDTFTGEENPFGYTEEVDCD